MQHSAHGENDETDTQAGQKRVPEGRDIAIERVLAAIGLGVTVLGINSLIHELGHALAVRWYGGRVRFLIIGSRLRWRRLPWIWWMVPWDGRIRHGGVAFERRWCVDWAGPAANGLLGVVMLPAVHWHPIGGGAAVLLSWISGISNLVWYRRSDGWGCWVHRHRNIFPDIYRHPCAPSQIPEPWPSPSERVKRWMSGIVIGGLVIVYSSRLTIDDLGSRLEDWELRSPRPHSASSSRKLSFSP